MAVGVSQVGSRIQSESVRWRLVAESKITFLIEILFYSHLNVSDWVAWFCTLLWVASVTDE